MKPIVRILIPKAIREELYAHIRSVLHSSYNGIEIIFELTEDVPVPTVSSFERNGVDLGSICNDPEAPSIAFFQGIKIALDEAYRREQ